MYVCRIRVYNRVIIRTLIISTIAGSEKNCSILSRGNVYCGLALAAKKLLPTFKRLIKVTSSFAYAV